MSVLSFDQFQDARASSAVVDVLPEPSFRAGHIPGAINLPVERVTEAARELIPDLAQRVVVYCRGPECPLGARAIELLNELGYSDLLHYEGGIEEWLEQGNKLEVSLSAVSTVDAPTRHILEIIDSFSIQQWMYGWCAVVIGCAMALWGGGELGWRWLWHNGQPLPTGWQSIPDCIYFSLVTATTLGYGDITPTGWARPLAAAEAMSGMIVVGAIISKLLSSRQEQLIQETHDLTFKERLSRIHTNLHFLIDDFQEAHADYNNPDVPHGNADRRFASSTMLLMRHLSVICDLLHERNRAIEEPAIEAVLVTLEATLESYLGARVSCELNQDDTSTRVAEIVDDICAECVPHQYSDSIRRHMDRAHRLAERIRT